jgi:hypothetical protein
MRYVSQIGFQFQGKQNAAQMLRDFALAEGNGRAAERLSGAALPAFLAETIA